MRGRSQSEVLHRPHLVLADAGRPDHVVAARRQPLERLEHALRLEHARRCRSGAGTPRASPRAGASHGSVFVCGASRACDLGRELGEHLLQRARRPGRPRGAACRSRPRRRRGGRRSRPARTPTSLPVTRSSKRAPTATSTSHLFIARFDHFGPCMPGQPKCSSCVSGNALFAHQRRDHGQPAGLGEREQLVAGVGVQRAAAHVEHRLLGGRDPLAPPPRSAADGRGSAASSRGGRPLRVAGSRAPPPGCPSGCRRAPGRSGPCARRGTPP